MRVPSRKQATVMAVPSVLEVALNCAVVKPPGSFRSSAADPVSDSVPEAKLPMVSLTPTRSMVSPGRKPVISSPPASPAVLPWMSQAAPAWNTTVPKSM